MIFIKENDGMRTLRANIHEITHVKPMRPEFSRYNFKNKDTGLLFLTSRALHSNCVNT